MRKIWYRFLETTFLIQAGIIAGAVAFVLLVSAGILILGG